MKLKTHIERWWTAWLVATGFVWLAGLTALNTFQGYFGWLLIVSSVHKEGIEWDPEPVYELCNAIAHWTSNYVFQQFLPLIMMGTGTFGLILQNVKLHKTLRDQATKTATESKD